MSNKRILIKNNLIKGEPIVTKINLTDGKYRSLINTIEDAISQELRWKIESIKLNREKITVHVTVDKNLVADLHNYDNSSDYLKDNFPSHIEIDLRINNNKKERYNGSPHQRRPRYKNKVFNKSR